MDEELVKEQINEMVVATKLGLSAAIESGLTNATVLFDRYMFDLYLKEGFTREEALQLVLKSNKK